MNRPVIAITRVLPGFPWAYRARHQEIEEPYRAADRALVVRIGFRRALVAGWLRATGLDEDGAHAAIGMYYDGEYRPPREESSDDATDGDPGRREDAPPGGEDAPAGHRGLVLHLD